MDSNHLPVAGGAVIGVVAVIATGSTDETLSA